MTYRCRVGVVVTAKSRDSRDSCPDGVTAIVTDIVTLSLALSPALSPPLSPELSQLLSQVLSFLSCKGDSAFWDSSRPIGTATGTATGTAQQSDRFRKHSSSLETIGNLGV